MSNSFSSPARLGRLILGSFVTIIALGTILLSLPIAQTHPLSLMDVLFSVTSTTCVTGLLTVPITSFTFFGKCVILALMQIGGLGLITLTLLVASLFLNLGMTTKLIAGHMLDFHAWSRIRQFLLLIAIVTIVCEIGGALLLWWAWQTPTPDGALFTAFFHAISAFCNAGILLDTAALPAHSTCPMVLCTLIALMVAGGIGFFVWHDLARCVHGWWRRRHTATGTPTRMSLHSRIVLRASFWLTIVGTYFFWRLEHLHTLAHLDTGYQILASLFMAIASRGPGLELIPVVMLSLPMLFFSMLLFFIGEGPGSTGSGVKTTTFVVFSETILSIVRNRESVEISGRSIAHDQVYKAIAIIALAAFWVFATTFALLLVEHELLSSGTWGFFDLFFESVSAFATCGYSTGVTPHLSGVGRGIIMLSMLVGRIGSLTLVLALQKRHASAPYQYPQERIMIG